MITDTQKMRLYVSCQIVINIKDAKQVSQQMPLIRASKQISRHVAINNFSKQQQK